MARKIGLDMHGITEGIRGGGKQQRINDLLGIGEFNEEKTAQNVSEIPLDKLTRRPINYYSQSNIELLAQDIKNNGLAEPIVVTRGKDFPKDSAVAKEFEKQGVKVDTVEYVITAGHRRVSAYKYLHEQELSDPGRDPLAPFRYDKIKAVILTPDEALREQEIYNATNLHARRVSDFELCLACRNELVLKTDTIEKKNEALIQMGLNPAEVKFKEYDYAIWYFEKKFGVVRKPNTVRDALQSIRSLHPDVINAISEGRLTMKDAQKMRSLSRDCQSELLTVHDRDAENFNAELERQKETPADKQKRRYTYKRAVNLANRIISDSGENRAELKNMIADLGDADRETVKEMIQAAEEYEKILKDKIAKFKKR